MLKINKILSAVAMLLIITAAVNSCDKEESNKFKLSSLLQKF